jgi:ribosomal protein S12 methylthiotransferase accessory factor
VTGPAAAPASFARTSGLRDVDWTPLTESLARLETLASPYVGVVKRLFEQLHDTDDARCHAVGALATRSERLIGAGCNELNGGGGTSQAGARAAAIGETVERYSGAYVPDDLVGPAAADELDLPVVAPASFEWFAPWQLAQADFPFRPFTATSRVRWAPGFSLDGGAPAWLPAQAAYLSQAVAEGEDRVIYATSNGLACGPTPEEAVLGGLLELLERDAFMLAWYGRLSLPLLDLSSDPRLVDEVTRVFAPAGLCHDLVDLSAFTGVPSVLAVVRNVHTDSAVLALGAGAATTMSVAVRKALVEAYQTRTWAKSEQRTRPDFAAGDPPLEDLVRDFDDHVRLYADPGQAAWAAFLTASEARRPVGEVPALEGERPLEHIEALVTRLRDRGLQAYALDLTSPDIRDAGLSVMKVLSPHLRPLDSSFRFRLLGGTRLAGARRHAGLVAEDLAPEEINPRPHPFP